MTERTINKFLIFKLPSAYLCGVRMRKLEENRAEVTVRYKWMNQNPFRSMYFAVQSMAAELSTGALVMKKIKDCGQPIAMLITNHSGSFSKKAVGRISFICNDGAIVDAALKETILDGEPQKFVMKSEGIDEMGEVVSSYEFEWSVKKRINN